jgi:uncharacterized damage-inducible protein DinB
MALRVESAGASSAHRPTWPVTWSDEIPDATHATFTVPQRLRRVFGGCCMSWVDQYRALARYNSWMNEKVYAATGGLPDAERKRDRGAFFKSIYGTLNHLTVADTIWMLRFTSDESYQARDARGAVIRIQGLAQALYEDFDELRARRKELDARMASWVDQLDEAALSAAFSFKTTAGVTVSSLLWQAVGHMFNHQTHHRGQITTVLTQQGVDIGSTDLVAMFREEAQGGR